MPAGVARSIESDVDNLMRLIRIANILPKGLYVESAVKVSQQTSQQHTDRDRYRRRGCHSGRVHWGGEHCGTCVYHKKQQRGIC